MDRFDLLERLKELPVIDMHEHFQTYEDTHGYNMPRFLYQNSYLNLFATFYPHELVDIINDSEKSPVQHFNALLEIERIARHTANGRFLHDLVKRFGVDMLDEGSFEQLNCYFNARTPQSIEVNTPTIKTTIANSLGHPLFGYCRGIKTFLDSPPELPESIKVILCVTPLHCIHGLAELSDLEYVSGQPISSLEDWEHCVRDIIYRCISLGIVGFKDIYMFFRTFSIDKPDESIAKNQFSAMLRGDKAGKVLLDTMLYKVFGIINETGLAAAIHTGFSIETCESALYMRSVIDLMKTYTNTRFDLLHINYPKMEDYLIALKSCPNAYANCAIIPTVDEEFFTQFLRQAVDTLLISRVSLFGGDRHCPGEPVACALDITLDHLSKAFYELITRSTISVSAALDIAGQWLYDNPKQIYTRK